MPAEALSALRRRVLRPGKRVSKFSSCQRRTAERRWSWLTFSLDDRFASLRAKSIIVSARADNEAMVSPLLGTFQYSREFSANVKVNWREEGPALIR